MVKVDKIIYRNDETKTAKVELFADTKAEVGSSKVVGLPAGYTIDFESSCMTADGELAFMKSDGTWNWL